MSKHRIGYITFGVLSLLYYLGILQFGWSYKILFLFLVVWLLMVIFGSFMLQSNYHLKAISKVKTNQPFIAITFDDGPTEFTQEILKLLSKHQAKATFFLVGKKAKEQPDLVKTISDNGHQIGNHSYSHSNYIGFLSTRKVLSEIQKTDDVLHEILGSKPQLFRPPFGVTNPAYNRALSKTKHKVIGWNVRSLDTVIKDDEIIFNRVKDKIKPGNIFLFHDTSKKTVRVLEQLLIEIENKGFKPVTVDELLNTEQ